METLYLMSGSMGEDHFWFFGLTRTCYRAVWFQGIHAIAEFFEYQLQLWPFWEIQHPLEGVGYVVFR